MLSAGLDALPWMLFVWNAADTASLGQLSVARCLGFYRIVPRRRYLSKKPIPRLRIPVGEARRELEWFPSYGRSLLAWFGSAYAIHL